ncbi:MFS transporter [Phytoactinopolyspora endophytica]|uniref:MFS transporter n=1 Tax=Phytoactinopolyspora endophytica TaxID=1642495 RepID=UPI00101D8093|nr:MFS transporter [Phytoactinopolyspora endophytica]
MVEVTKNKAGRREWIGLAVLTLPALLASMDLSVLFMAVPWLSADLEPTGTQLLWIMDIYGFFIAGLLITMGTLGDRMGRRKLLMIGAVAFGAASLMAAYSTSAEMLIVARALLGIGGATLAPSTLALIRNMFHDDAERRTAVAIWTGAFSAGFPLGSIIGGLLVEQFWWGSVFLINIPVMVMLLVLAPMLLPEYKDPRPGRFDLIGAVLAMAAVLLVIWALKEFAEYGWDVLPAIAMAIGSILGYLFVRRQRSRPDPLLDVGLFRYPAFSASIGANLVLILASAGVGMLVVQHMQLVMDYRPVTAALWMLPMVAVMMVGISLGTMAVRWIRPGVVVGAGLAFGAVGFALLTRLDADDSIAALIGGYSVMGFGMGTALSMAYNMVIATAPAENAGAAAAVNETGSELGGALGIATLGSLAAAVYTDEVRDALPRDISAEAADTATGTLGGAVAVAEELPPELAETMVAGARDAFVHGLNMSAVFGAALLGVAAVVVTLLLRKVPLPSTSE